MTRLKRCKPRWPYLQGATIGTNTADLFGGIRDEPAHPQRRRSPIGGVGPVSGFELGIRRCTLTLPWHGHAVRPLGRTKRHPRHRADLVVQSKHGPLIVRGSFAMCLLASNASQHGTLQARRRVVQWSKRGLASTLFPFVNQLHRPRRIKLRPKRGHRHCAALRPANPTTEHLPISIQNACIICVPDIKRNMLPGSQSLHNPEIVSRR